MNALKKMRALDMFKKKWEALILKRIRSWMSGSVGIIISLLSPRFAKVFICRVKLSNL